MRARDYQDLARENTLPQDGLVGGDGEARQFLCFVLSKRVIALKEAL